MKYVQSTVELYVKQNTVIEGYAYFSEGPGKIDNELRDFISVFCKEFKGKLKDCWEKYINVKSINGLPMHAERAHYGVCRKKCCLFLGLFQKITL